MKPTSIDRLWIPVLLVFLGALTADGQNVTLIAGSATGVAPGSSVVITVSYDSDTTMESIQFGFAHDSGVVSIDAVVENLDLLGNDPDFVFLTILPDGFTLGVVPDLQGLDLLPVDSDFGIVDVTYSVAPVPTSPQTSLVFVDTLDGGSGPVQTVVVILGSFFTPETVPGFIGVGGFVRGDVTADQILALNDAILLLDFLFGTGTVPCSDAADISDDGVLALNDGVLLLLWLFTPGSPAPPAPYPDCGGDPTPDSLSCLISSCVP